MIRKVKQTLSHRTERKEKKEKKEEIHEKWNRHLEFLRKFFSEKETHEKNISDSSLKRKKDEKR